MRFVILIFLFIPVVYFAQDSTLNRVGLQTGINRMDFQVGFNYKYDHLALKPFASFELGVNRTMFQHRIFPRFTIGAEYCLLKARNLQFGPQLCYSYSILKVNNSSSHANSYNEVYGGLYVCLGGKVQFKTALLTGWQNERYFSTYSGKMNGANTLGFTVNFGVSYAF